MQSRLTINIQVSYVSNWQHTLDFLRKLNPFAVVACIDNMSNIGRIDEIATNLPDAKIIGRFIFNGDGGMHLKPQAPGDNRQYIVSPTDALNAWGALGKGKNRMLYFANEPQVTGAAVDNIARHVAHTSETIQLATQRGIALVIGNYGIGQHLTPAFDAVLHLLSVHSDIHALGIHCYAPADLTEGLDTIGERCRVLGIKMPKTHITEFGYDASNGSDPLNGYKSRNISGIQYATWQKNCIQNVYSYYLNNGILQSVATFTWGNDASWKAFNVETDIDWQATILDYATKGLLDISPTPPPPVVTPPPATSILVPISTLVSLRDTIDGLLKGK